MKVQKNKRWITIYAVLAALLIAFHYLLEIKIFDSWSPYIPLLKKLSLSLFLISIFFLVSRIIGRLINTQDHLEGDKYNLIRTTRFLAIVFSLIVVASFLFQNLIAAAVSFGLISLVLGFALQAPITSFVAWIYLIFRRSYLVGDRIQINNGILKSILELILLLGWRRSFLIL